VKGNSLRYQDTEYIHAALGKYADYLTGNNAYVKDPQPLEDLCLCSIKIISFNYK
jgi:hypothetical protein